MGYDFLNRIRYIFLLLMVYLFIFFLNLGTETTQKTILKKIRLLDVAFENEILAWEVPAFRGAVIESAGRKNILFHNHENDKFVYSYPLIQYKRIGKRPHLICIDDGVDEIHKFFENIQEGVFLNERPYELKIGKLGLNTFTMQVWDKAFRYNIFDWLPLNQENFNKFRILTDESEQIQFLNKILTGNILSFAKGINWEVDKPIITKIDKIVHRKSLRIKGVNREVFDVLFKTNVFLPNNIGLGKNCSLGFGIIKEVRRNPMRK
jgi:hypothetical protein